MRRKELPGKTVGELPPKKSISMKTVEIYTDGEDGFAASMIKSRPARRLRGNRRTWQHTPSVCPPDGESEFL